MNRAGWVNRYLRDLLAQLEAEEEAGDISTPVEAAKPIRLVRPVTVLTYVPYGSRTRVRAHATPYRARSGTRVA